MASRGGKRGRGSRGANRPRNDGRPNDAVEESEDTMRRYSLQTGDVMDMDTEPLYHDASHSEAQRQSGRCGTAAQQRRGPPPTMYGGASYRDHSEYVPSTAMDGALAMDGIAGAQPMPSHRDNPQAGVGSGTMAEASMFDRSEMEGDSPPPSRRRESISDDVDPNTRKSLATATGAANEFTKRKNWSQRVIDDIQDFLHVLNPNGLFLFISPSIKDLCGYRPEELVGRSIVDFIHVDDQEAYTRDFNAALHTKGEMALYTRFRKKDDRYIIFEMTGHPHFVSPTDPEQPPPPSTSKSAATEENAEICNCVFAIGRPYPSKNAAMLDSFLDLKIENEKLRTRLENMYKEIESEGGLRSLGGALVLDGLAGPSGSWQQGSGLNTGDGTHTGPITGIDGVGNFQGAVGTGTRVDGVPGGPSGGSGPGIEYDNSPNLAGTHGLYPSSGNTYGALGIGISSSQRGGQFSGAANNETNQLANAATGDKKKLKKPKVDEGDFVCRDCGTVDSPEWRKGPEGPKTLCNACGLRWAKKSKPSKTASPKAAGRSLGP